MYLKSLSLRYILLYGPFYMVRSVKNRWKVWGVITFLFGSLSVEASEPVYVNVLSTGVVNDGVTMNTRALQSAIDSCAHAGGGTLYFPSGRYLTGSLFLRDNITLFLEAGAVVLGSPDLKDYYLPEQSYISFRNDVAAVINAEYCRNIKLTGLGTFDGQGALFPIRYEAYRPKLFRFVGCENVVIQDLTFQNSAFWMMHVLACKYVNIDGIKVHNRFCNVNNDGMDIDNSQHVHISNCYIDAEDDGICLKSTSADICRDITITNCTLTSDCNAIKMGTETNTGFRNIAISNCVVYNTRYSGIALEIVDSGVMENVLIKNIVMSRVNNPLFIRLGNRARPYHPDSLVRNVGSIKNIFISDIVATEIGRFTDYAPVHRIEGEKRGSEYPCVISGIPGAPVESVTLSNLSFSFKGSRVLPVAGPVPEQEAMYPEYKMFGPLPAYGLYARHVKSLTLNNVVFSTDSADSRVPVYCEDIERLTLKGLDVEVSEQTPSYVMLKDVGHTTIFDSAFLERGPEPVVASGEVGPICLSGCIGPDGTSVEGRLQRGERENAITRQP